MQVIKLNRGFEATVDDEDFDRINAFKWTVTVRERGAYAIRSVGPAGKQKWVYMHRQVMNAEPGIEVDHVNRNGLNNQKHNLRMATRSQNSFNSGLSANNKSGVRGVHWAKKAQRWSVQICAKHIGYFKSKEDAIVARQLAEREHFGEFTPA